MEVVSLTYRKPQHRAGNSIEKKILDYLADGVPRGFDEIWLYVHPNGGCTTLFRTLMLALCRSGKVVKNGSVTGQWMYSLA